jgi:sugar lactone lactonase YvrE
MATTSFTVLRRFAGFAFTLMLFSLCLTGLASGQGSPLVTASSAAGLSHPTGWGTILQTAIDSNGDWLVVDYPNGSLYEFPAGGTTASVALVQPNSLGSEGGYQNPGVLIDPGNNLYVEGNFNNCLLMFPYGSAASPWPGLSTTLTPSTTSSSYCYSNNGSKTEATGDFPDFAETGTYISFPPYYMQPWGLAVGAGPTANSLVIGNQQSSNLLIWGLPVTGAWANPVAKTGSATEFISGLLARPNSIAVDPEGSIYFVEDSGGLPGVYQIPASAVAAAIAAGGANGALASDCPSPVAAPTGSSCLTRVDPNLPSVKGVITDAAGNLYISDSQVGVVEVPNPSGTPETSSAVLVTPVPSQGEVAIDGLRSLMYVPTPQTQTNGQADVAKVGFGYADFGPSAVGKTASAGPNVVFGFNGSVTPANFTIIEDGVQNPDFAITGGTCTTGVAYASGNSCLENISFTPNSVGNISAKLLMLDANNNILASMVLHGLGMGANIQTTPSLQSTLGSGLVTPTQVATDALGNVYIADPGQGKVLEYAAGSSTAVSIGAGLTSPTGVSVDGSGDVFIADSGTGSVYEVPFGPSGLNSKGQVTLASGLGTAGLQLASDGLDHLYVADPSKGRVVKLSDIGASTTASLGQAETTLTTGFTSPSAVAVDAANNLYVIDGVNLFELAGGAGAPVTLLNNLSGATGLAVDPSGAVYISSASGTTRIPYVSGALNPLGETAVASTVTNTSSVALDRANNIYLVQATGGSVTVVSTNGTLTLPTPASLTSSSNAIATITNTGNSTLTVTGYTSTNSVDYSGADTATGGCEAGSPIAAGASCTVNVTFAPGAGEQGTLTSQIGITSTAVNSPIVIDATGVALALTNSATKVVGGASAAQVINTPLTIAVAPNSGAGVAPTGTVTVSYTTWTVVIVAGGPTITPQTATATSNLTNGSATFVLAPVLAGTQTVTVSYSGDRVYGRSTGTLSVDVAKSAIAGIKLPPLPDPTDIDLPFVPAGTGSGTVPYDGSEQPFQYNFIMAVNTTAGVPTGSITVMDNVSACPPGTSASGIGAATCVLPGYATPGGYSGVACPNSSGSGVLTIENAGTPTGAEASFPTSCLWFVPQGVTYSPVIYTHYIYPVYSGDANFLQSTGTTSTLLQSVRGPMVQITQTGNAASQTVAPSLTVQAGSSASMNLTLTSILGYGIAGLNAQLNASNLPVSLTCDNLPPHTQCSFSYPNPDPIVPNAVDIPCPSGATTTEIADGSVQCTPGQATVTFYTDVSAGTTTSQNARTTSVTLAAIFGFGMIGLFFRRRTFEKGRLLVMVLLMVVGGALAVSITACNTTVLTPGASLSTPAGAYAVTITADEVGTLCVSEPGGQGDNCIVPGSGSASDNGILVYGSQNQVSIPFYVNVTVQ